MAPLVPAKMTPGLKWVLEGLDYSAHRIDHSIDITGSELDRATELVSWGSRQIGVDASAVVHKTIANEKSLIEPCTVDGAHHFREHSLVLISEAGMFKHKLTNTFVHRLQFRVVPRKLLEQLVGFCKLLFDRRQTESAGRAKLRLADKGCFDGVLKCGASGSQRRAAYHLKIPIAFCGNILKNPLRALTIGIEGVSAFAAVSYTEHCREVFFRLWQHRQQLKRPHRAGVNGQHCLKMLNCPPLLVQR